MSRRAAPIIISALILGAVFNWFFIDKLPGISILIYTCLVLWLSFSLVWKFRSTVNRAVYWLLPAILFFSAMSFVLANQFLAFVNSCVVIYLLALGLRLMHMPATKLKEFEVADYLLLPKKLIGGCARAFTAFFDAVFMSWKLNSRTRNFAPIVRGVLITLPILAVFLLLLSSADLVFGKFLGSLVQLDISPEFIVRLGVIGVIASIFIAAFAYIFMPHTAGEPTALDAKRPLGATESFIILGSVTALFLIFVLIQSAYLFGGSSHISSTGYTYAEYARKGFFELIAVAAISLMLVGAIKKITAFKTSGQKMVFKWLSGLLILEVVVIMFSAHKRLNLYESAYGFTTLRLFSHLFILWLVYAFAQQLYHIIRNKRDSSYAFQLFVSMLCFLALISLINPDNFIAKRNISRYYSVGKIDIAYLNTLSEDATPTIAGLLDTPEEAVRRQVAGNLYMQKQQMDNEPEDWMSANLGRQRASDVLHSRIKQITSLKANQ